MREGQLAAAVGDRRQDRRLLRRAAGQADRGPAQHHRRQIGLQRQRAAEFLHHQHQLDRPAAEAAVLLGERHAEQAEFGVLRPHVRAPARGLFQEPLARLEAVAIRHQPRDAVRQQALVVGEIEIHQSLSTALERMFFCISLVPP